MKHVILFGGSFDPIHNGHIRIAREALKQCHANELWFVLAAVSPFKEAGTDFSKRLRMLELAVKPYRKFKISTVEKMLPKPSYSIDTIRYLKKHHPNTRFSWLIGSDQIRDLHKWKDFETLNSLVNFIVYKRPGYHDSHSYQEIDGMSYNVSSTAIREGQSTDAPSSVLNYMMREGLYLDTMTQLKMSKKRYEHTLRVRHLALELASVYGLNLKDVNLATMVHDWCKEDDSEDLKRNMPDHLLYLDPAFYHAFKAADVLSKRYGIRNKAILNAIRGHVNGKNTHPLAMVVYIADKCEPSRSYDATALIELAKQDLRRGFKAVRSKSNEFNKKERL